MFDQTGKMEGESVLFLEGTESSLRFQPTKIVEVTSYDKSVIYREGEDYIIRGKRIERTENSRIPLVTQGEYWGQDCDPTTASYMVRFQIERPRYSEEFFVDRQILVTYFFDPQEAAGIFGVNVAGDVSAVRTLIREKKPVRLLLYGDSISVGMTSSAQMNRPPYRKNFFDQLCDRVRQCGCSVTGENTSEGGMGTFWAIEQMKERWSNHPADLSILGWGMNDATMLLSPEDYRKNIEVLLANRPKDSDCLIITPMIANPDAAMVGRKEGYFTWQDQYYDAVRSLASDHVGILDMAYVHKRLLEGKKYVDMTGNNINHPNDFLASVYCDALCHFLRID